MAAAERAQRVAALPLLLVSTLSVLQCEEKEGGPRGRGAPSTDDDDDDEQRPLFGAALQRSATRDGR